MFTPHFAIGDIYITICRGILVAALTAVAVFWHERHSNIYVLTLFALRDGAVYRRRRCRNLNEEYRRMLTHGGLANHMLHRLRTGWRRTAI